MAWYTLPVEVHLMVLSFLAASERAQGASLTGYALVSRQWQPVFERLTFRRVSVKSSGIETFKAAFRHVRRRRYLEHLTLAVEFDKEDDQKHHDQDRRIRTIFNLCLDATRPDADHGRRVRTLLARDDGAFTSCLTGLLSVLSTWSTKECSPQGITLSVLAMSESRWQRKARWLRWAIGQPGMANWEARLSRSALEFCLASGESDFGFSLNLDTSHVLPTVQVISGLAIPRNSVRAVHVDAVTALLRSFPAVSRLDWEVRRRFPKLVETEFQEGLAAALPSWPPSLKEVRLHRLGRFYLEAGLMRAREPVFAPLAPALAKCASQGLEHLSVSYATDVPAFFFGHDTKTQWTRLRSLTLKSGARPIVEFLPSTTHAVEAVAQAVWRMPSLEWLLVYHCRNTAAAFRYERRPGRVVITAVASQPFDLGESCRAAWESVSKPLEVEWRVAERPLDEIKVDLQNILSRSITSVR